MGFAKRRFGNDDIVRRRRWAFALGCVVFVYAAVAAVIVALAAAMLVVSAVLSRRAT
jgi:hypothetical protein